MQANSVTSLHFNVRNISRSGSQKALASAAYRSGTRLRAAQKARVEHGISVVARASYRSGESLHDERTGQTYDFRRKEDVRFTAVWTPDQAPDSLKNRETLWNTIEQIEKRKDAQLAKDFTAALPRTLNLEQHIAILREFCEKEFLSRDLIVDVAAHNKRASDQGENPHAHIMVTTRSVNPDGTFGNKDRSLDKKETLREWRQSFQDICNRHLEDAGSTQRVSLDSFKTRGIDRMPTVHLGHEAWQSEAKGIQTRPGDINRTAYHVNSLRDMLNQQGMDVRPVQEPLPDQQNSRGLAELTHQDETGGESSGGHDGHVRHMMQSLATPVVQARLALSHKMNQLRTWWEERQQTRLPEPQPPETVFNRHQPENLRASARLLHTEKEEEDHER